MVCMPQPNNPLPLPQSERIACTYGEGMVWILVCISLSLVSLVRGTADGVMLMSMMEKHPEGEIVGRDAQSAFNTLGREHTGKILEGQGWLRDWIGD